jgi:hypothetical protein
MLQHLLWWVGATLPYRRWALQPFILSTTLSIWTGRKNRPDNAWSVSPFAPHGSFAVTNLKPWIIASREEDYAIGRPQSLLARRPQFSQKSLMTKSRLFRSLHLSRGQPSHWAFDGFLEQSTGLAISLARLHALFPGSVYPGQLCRCRRKATATVRMPQLPIKASTSIGITAPPTCPSKEDRATTVGLLWMVIERAT